MIELLAILQSYLTVEHVADLTQFVLSTLDHEATCPTTDSQMPQRWLAIVEGTTGPVGGSAHPASGTTAG
jgi:hypothetical protein